MKTEQHTAKNKWVSEVIREEINRFLESNENENTTYQNLWDTAKTVLEFIALSIYNQKKKKNLQKKPPETSQTT
jgi:hypothetical protein